MYQAFSEKQRQLLTWWMPGNPNCGMEAIICDGAVRSGKTMAMGLSFFLWAQSCFDGQQFGICGKTIASLRRNVLSEILPKLEGLGAKWKEKRTENLVTVQFLGHENRFYVFGGRDESSASLIQGITFAGILLDEAALMPRSFVEQACARCSVAGSRLWFNCNPAGPGHWLYKNWILEAEQRNCLRLHFTMEDNPSLTPRIRQRYQNLYTGIFYQRFVLGQWVQAEGRVYDFFTPELVGKAPESCDKWYISCDYGTVNPMSMGLWGRHQGVWYRVKEFYFNSRQEHRQMTDAEYADALQKLAGGRTITAVIVDPSAASFLEVLRRRGWRVQKAKNDVLSGIRLTADLLKNGRIVICEGCSDCLREMEEYVWDLSGGADRVRKEHDHAMDDMRYFAATVLGGETGWVCSVFSGTEKVKGVYFLKRKKKESGSMAAVCQLRNGDVHPFGAMRSFTPLGGGEERVYREMREAIPVLDAAVSKMVRLCGGFQVKCRDKEAQKRLNRFLLTVPCGRGQTGMDSFLSAYLDSLLTYGRAVGEMVVAGGKLRAVCWGDVTKLEVQEGENSLETVLWGMDRYGHMRPLPYQHLLLFTTMHPEPAHPYGVSMFRGMPFLADILLKIYNTIGSNWERAGNIRYSVICKGGEELDPASVQERGKQVAAEWAKAMEDSKNGTVRDFVAVGDVEIKVIGNEAPILDSDVPVRQIMEQLVAKTGLPPFLLGLSWSTTERMSTQQADLLTSELWALRRTVEPALNRVCRMYLALEGLDDRFEIEWDDISLQDITQEAQADLYRAQAEKYRAECTGE